MLVVGAFEPGFVSPDSSLSASEVCSREFSRALGEFGVFVVRRTRGVYTCHLAVHAPWYFVVVRLDDCCVAGRDRAVRRF